MKINNTRLFPYPVYSEDRNDYRDATFTSDYSYFYEGDEVVIKYSVNISNQELIELILSGVLQLYINIECGATKYRDTFPISYPSGEIMINNTRLNISAELITLIVVRDEVEEYKNSQLDPFYDIQKIRLMKGTIVGYSPMQQIVIQKKIENNGQVPSIFNINISEEDSDMTYLLADEQIQVFLPRSTYEVYNDLKGQYIRIKQAMIILPVLQAALEEIKKGEESFDGKIWYIVIEEAIKKLGKGYEVGFASETFKNADSLRIGQSILKQVIPDSFSELNAINLKLD